MEVTAGLPSVTLQGIISAVPSTGFWVSNGCTEGGSVEIKNQTLSQDKLCIIYIKSLK